MPAKPKRHYARAKQFREHERDPRVLRDCPDEKLSYDTYAIANEFASKNDKLLGHKTWPYRCRFCHRWHLTSQPQTERK
jgi:hypothetical protein